MAKEPGSSDSHASSERADSPALRFITCGSVDDGKSTLIGRLLFEQELIQADHLSALEADSKKYGTTGDEIDFALLLDGLEAEREQAITIDVAYRYFSTERRSFVVADTPGHEQYTRNMVTGASNADLAIVLADARKGLMTQSFRHTNLVSLLRLPHIVLAVNKMDLVDFSEERFCAIRDEFQSFCFQLGFHSIAAIPISARFGDNISNVSERSPWFTGKALLRYLESVSIRPAEADRGFRMPIQWVNRPNLDFRGYSGRVSRASGAVRVGDEVVALPSGRRTSIARIVTADGDLLSAVRGESVTITLDDAIDLSRGDVLTSTKVMPCMADQFAAHLIWMSDAKMLAGRPYLMKIGTKTVLVSVTGVKYRLDPSSQAHIAASSLALNEIGFCNFSCPEIIVMDRYENDPSLGAFILIDRDSNETVGAGLIAHELRRSLNITHQDFTVDKVARSRLKHHRPVVLWFTGLSGSGKSTVADLVERLLLKHGVHTAMLDGDNVRHGLNRDLGFSDADRVENIRRAGEVAKLMLNAGLVVLCAFISPFHAERRMVRELFDSEEFIEIFIDTPLDICIARDPKGLYKRALAGEILNFTGIDQAYEPPENPEMTFRAGSRSAQDIADQIVAELQQRGVIGPL